MEQFQVPLDVVGYATFLKTGIDLNPGNDQAHFVCVKMSVNEN
jgi:hypothetical protein